MRGDACKLVGGVCPAGCGSGCWKVLPAAKEPSQTEQVDHPAYYGGDSVYEAIKVIEAWQLPFDIGNAVKYIARAGKKGDRLQDLEKALWYLSRAVGNEKAARGE